MVQSRWHLSQRRDRFNADWARTRRLVLERDGYKCQRVMFDAASGVERLCGRPAREVDHIVRAVDGVDDDRLSNLESLCRFHHQVKTEAESAQARRERARERALGRWYSHPVFG